MNPSLPFGPPDPFYLEAFSQDEAFAAIDAENRRRGFGTAPACASHSSSWHYFPLSMDSSMHCMPAPGGGQQKRPRQPEQHAAEPATLLRFVRPWCREEVRVGRSAAVRKYVAASYCRMWENTQASLANNRHFYEIVRESSPCHIYFDLEFAIVDNQDVDGNSKVDCLLNIVASLTKTAWGIHIGPENVLEMESVNPAKFSRHVVVSMPNAAFQSGPDLGRFVKDAVLQHKAAHTLQVKAGQNLVPIVDTSVYSRNRCFRCLFSSKAPTAGAVPPGSPFQLTGRYPPVGWTLPAPLQWLSSLVCHVPPSVNFLQFSAQQVAAVSMLIVSKPVMLPPPVVSPVDSGVIVTGIISMTSTWRGWACAHAFLFKHEGTDMDGVEGAEWSVQLKWAFGAQATPERMSFLRRAIPYMLDAAKELCGPGVGIRKVCVLGSRGLVAFDLDGQAGRYCSWEGRCHHSNFTILKVDFWHGTFAHQCWDPLCKSKFQRLWNAHQYELPRALQGHHHLFQDPEEFDPHLEDFLVASNGERMYDPDELELETANLPAPVPVSTIQASCLQDSCAGDVSSNIARKGWTVQMDAPVEYRC